MREHFPILGQQVNGKPLAYLDSAASSQVPIPVMQAFVKHYTTDHSNIHRGIHHLAEESTKKYEEAREKVAQFLHATADEIVFTHGTTESVNLVAYSLLATFPAGSEIIVTEMEHHSNFVTWQQLAKRHNLIFKIIPITPDFRLDMEAARSLITENTKLVAVSHVSNVLGTLNPIKELAQLAHGKGALLFVDGAQAVAHMPVNVKALGVDFYTFSGHKLYAPTGIGVLYGRKQLLEQLSPFHYGGGMINTVSTEDTTFAECPAKFEAGTPNIVGAICLGAAIDFVNEQGLLQIQGHEKELTAYALEQLKDVPGVAVIGPQEVFGRTGVISVIVEGVHEHDLAAVLNNEGVAVRAGTHCAQPLANRLQIQATARLSIGMYNTKEDIDRFIMALKKAKELFA